MENLDSTSDVKILRAVADPIRYAIILRLLRSPATQKELSEQLELNSGTLSKHMAKLTDAYLVGRERSHGPYELRFRDGVWKLLQGYTNLKTEVARELTAAAEREAAALNRAGLRTSVGAQSESA